MFTNRHRSNVVANSRELTAPGAAEHAFRELLAPGYSAERKDRELLPTAHYPLPTMQRRGFSLIEMLVAITVSSVLLGIAVSLLVLLLRAEKTGRDRVRQASVSSQLAEQFRSDVGAALRQIPANDEKPNEWQFAMTGDRTVTYRALPGEVERTESASGKPVRQESYALPAGYSAAVVVEPEATPPVASLIIKSDGTPPVGSREIRIMAELGKDHRFAKLPEGSR